jgi:hypothetical protein
MTPKLRVTSLNLCGIKKLQRRFFCTRSAIFTILFTLMISSSLIVATTIYIPEHVPAFSAQLTTATPTTLNPANVSAPVSQLTNASKAPVNVLEATMRLLVNDTISALKSGDTNRALTHLKLVDQELTTTAGNSTLVQTSKLLVEDAIQSIQSDDINKALAHLNLVAQQLAIPSSSNAAVLGQQPKLNNSSSTKIQTNTTNFSTYDNPILAIRIQYPHDWSISEHTFNPAANNTIVSFFSPSKSASALGNLSGVSGNFVPYVDIFVFPSKNMSLPKLVNGTIKKFGFNNMTLVPNESKPIILKGGAPAYVITYLVTIAGDELFKKMQLWTVKADKVFVITYTAQEGLYSNYLPTIHKMIDSFAFIPGINATPKLTNTNHPSVTNNNTLPPAAPTGLLPPLSR